MARRIAWGVLGLAALVGLYALAGLVLGSRYDEKVAAFRETEAHADLVRRNADIPAAENAVTLFADAARHLEGLPVPYVQYGYAWGWDDEETREGFNEEVAAEWAERRSEERKGALSSLEPFVTALAVALERPAVQCPAGWSEAQDTLRLARAMLPVRARLLPERAAESADLLLRLATRWRTRDSLEPLARYDLLREALRIVRDILAREPEQARPYLGAWREWLAGEDPLSEFRFRCATSALSTAEAVEQVRRGEDPFASARESVRQVKETLRDDPPDAERTAMLARMGNAVETPWFFRWWARPVLYRGAIAGTDASTAAIDAAATDAGLRGLLDRGSLDRINRIVAVQTLEQIALTRLAQVALAVAAGEAPPELKDPFTGQPLSLRREGAATMVSATLPHRFRDGTRAAELLSWEVRR